MRRRRRPKDLQIGELSSSRLFRIGRRMNEKIGVLLFFETTEIRQIA